jgi:hypothetical protein
MSSQSASATVPAQQDWKGPISQIALGIVAGVGISLVVLLLLFLSRLVDCAFHDPVNWVPAFLVTFFGSLAAITVIPLLIGGLGLWYVNQVRRVPFQTWKFAAGAGAATYAGSTLFLFSFWLGTTFAAWPCNGW